MTETSKVTNAVRVYLYRDNHHYLQVSEVKPGAHRESVEFVRADNTEVSAEDIGFVTLKKES